MMLSNLQIRDPMSYQRGTCIISKRILSDLQIRYPLSSQRGSCVFSKSILCKSSRLTCVFSKKILCHLQEVPVSSLRGSCVIYKINVCHHLQNSCVISNSVLSLTLKILSHLQIFLCHLWLKHVWSPRGSCVIYKINVRHHLQNSCDISNSPTLKILSHLQIFLCHLWLKHAWPPRLSRVISKRILSDLQIRYPMSTPTIPMSLSSPRLSCVIFKYVCVISDKNLCHFQEDPVSSSKILVSSPKGCWVISK